MKKDIPQTLRDKIDEIMDVFDFEKVKKVMDCLDWKYYDDTDKYYYPDVVDLRKTARRLLLDSYFCRYISTGGFIAEYYEDNIDYPFSLLFVVEEQGLL